MLARERRFGGSVELWPGEGELSAPPNQGRERQAARSACAASVLTRSMACNPKAFAVVTSLERG
jgi:hypothetical protein